MNTIITTLKKELASYFFSPVGYVIAVLFYLFRGWEVYAQTRQLAAGPGRGEWLYSEGVRPHQSLKALVKFAA